MKNVLDNAKQMTRSPSSESPFCSLHSCRCLSKPENNSVRSHWEEKYNKRKNGFTYATTQILLWLVPHWQPAWYRAFPGTPSQGLKAGENLRGCGRPWDWQIRPAFCSVLRCNGHLEVALWQRGKGRAYRRSGPLEIVLAMHLSIRKSGPNSEIKTSF